MRLNFRLDGYFSRQYLWTVRSRNDRATTLLLEVFTQRNFITYFIRLKSTFTQKKRKNRLEPHFRGLRVNERTPPITHWKVRGRLYIRYN